MSSAVGTSVQNILETLRQKVTTGTPGRDGKGKLIQFFQDVIGQRVKKIPASLHAEILLRTLGLVLCEEITLGTNGERLQEFCDVSQHSFIMPSSSIYVIPRQFFSARF